MPMKTTKKKRKSIQSYAFIDTNIFLDFYRHNNEATLTLLEKLGTVQERVISTYQVEMEFLKNRQTTFLKAIREVSVEIKGAVPAVVTDTQTMEVLKNLRKDGKKRIKSLNNKVENVLKNPNANDRVYRVLEGIFASENSHVLTRDMPERKRIKKQASRRFRLGYPPRKDNDTSCGDALNREWIIECSKILRGRIYIVSRDGDYGCEHNEKFYLNDQLKKEFRDRVGNKSVVFTKSLSEALRGLKVQVTKKEEDAEKLTLSNRFGPNWRSSINVTDAVVEGFRRASVPNHSQELINALTGFRAAVSPLYLDELGTDEEPPE